MCQTSVAAAGFNRERRDESRALSLVVSDTFSGGGKRMGVVETAAKGVVRSASSELGRTIMRGILGSIFGGRKR